MPARLLPRWLDIRSEGWRAALWILGLSQFSLLSLLPASEHRSKDD